MILIMIWFPIILAFLQMRLAMLKSLDEDCFLQRAVSFSAAESDNRHMCASRSPVLICFRDCQVLSVLPSFNLKALPSAGGADGASAGAGGL